MDIIRNDGLCFSPGLVFRLLNFTEIKFSENVWEILCAILFLLFNKILESGYQEFHHCVMHFAKCAEVYSPGNYDFIINTNEDKLITLNLNLDIHFQAVFMGFTKRFIVLY